MHGTEVFVYLDDIVVYAESLEEHNKKAKRLLDRLRSANLKLQPDKCNFLRTKVTYRLSTKKNYYRTVLCLIIKSI